MLDFSYDDLNEPQRLKEQKIFRNFKITKVQVTPMSIRKRLARSGFGKFHTTRHKSKLKK